MKNFKPERRRTAKSRHARLLSEGPSFEKLENRVLFCTGSVVDGILVINGTDENDIIFIQKGQDFSGTVSVNCNGVDTVYNGVNSIVVNAGGGNDYVEVFGDEIRQDDNSSLPVPITLNGDAGNDVLIDQTTNPTTANGGAGDDHIVLGNGDSGNGGEDNDTLQGFGSPGPVFTGGSGADNFIGGQPTDYNPEEGDKKWPPSGGWCGVIHLILSLDPTGEVREASEETLCNASEDLPPII